MHLGLVRNINSTETIVFFHAAAAWLIMPVQSKTSRCRDTQEKPVYLAEFRVFFLYFSRKFTIDSPSLLGREVL